VLLPPLIIAHKEDTMKIACTILIAFNFLSKTDAFAPLPTSQRGLAIASLDTSTILAAETKKDDKDETAPNKPDVPKLLEPFTEALDPTYKAKGIIGDGDFIISRSGGPLKEELSNENLYKILMLECNDLEVNTLVWKCLGYRFDEEAVEWTAAEVFPKWKENFPTPPDCIGMARIYSKEVDQPSLKANQSIVRSVPVDNKQSLKTHLKPLGFTGYQFAELTPNKTRRAQCANWLLYYREELFGYTVEELREKRRLKKEAEEVEKHRLEEESGKPAEDVWKPPVKEVF
jgi:hypothetical protein